MPERDAPDYQDVCTIVVLYDNDATRARALVACDYLVKQFWQHVELKFHWWRTDFLLDTQLAGVAGDNAVAADFLVVSAESDSLCSPGLESWFESWLNRRRGSQGALVDLGASAKRHTMRTQLLMEVGRRGGFDYLTAMPDGNDDAPPIDPRSPLSGTIDEILGDSRPPTHYGLNE